MTLLVIATKDFEQGEALAIPSFFGDSSDTELKNLHFHVRNLIVLKEYFFEVDIDQDNELAEVGCHHEKKCHQFIPKQCHHHPHHELGYLIPGVNHIINYQRHLPGADYHPLFWY